MSIALVLVGLSSGLAHSVYSAFSKALLKNRTREPLLLFLNINILQALVTPLLWIVVRPRFPRPEGWTPLLISCATCVVAYLLLYMALGWGDVSSVMPIMGSKVIFAGLLAIPMLHEEHHWRVYVAAVLVAISIAMLSYSPSGSGRGTFPLKPIVLMTSCCVVFGLTDILIKRSLVHLDPYNFMIYYNLTVGGLSLCVIPYLRNKKVPLILRGMDLQISCCAAVSLVAATLLFVILLEMCSGVVIPNILQATRGIFVVLISAVLAHHGSTALETQSGQVYALRLAASVLMMASIWIALSSSLPPM